MKDGSKHNTVFMDAYFNAKEKNQLTKPNDFSMKYNNFERHMLMYYNADM